MFHISLRYFKDNEDWKEFLKAAPSSFLSTIRETNIYLFGKKCVSKENHFSFKFQLKTCKKDSFLKEIIFMPNFILCMGFQGCKREFF
jgi:hypothetical protein